VIWRKHSSCIALDGIGWLCIASNGNGIGYIYSMALVVGQKDCILRERRTAQRVGDSFRHLDGKLHKLSMAWHDIKLSSLLMDCVRFCPYYFWFLLACRLEIR
jgi:hypothetical protein